VNECVPCDMVEFVDACVNVVSFDSFSFFNACEINVVYGLLVCCYGFAGNVES